MLLLLLRDQNIPLILRKLIPIAVACVLALTKMIYWLKPEWTGYIAHVGVGSTRAAWTIEVITDDNGEERLCPLCQSLALECHSCVCT